MPAAGSGKILVSTARIRMIVSSVGREAVMEWVVKIETKNGRGEVETIEVGRLARRPTGLSAEEFGLTLTEGKNLDRCRSGFGLGPKAWR
jgi:hypothetical protein